MLTIILYSFLLIGLSSARELIKWDISKIELNMEQVTVAYFTINEITTNENDVMVEAVSLDKGIVNIGTPVIIDKNITTWIGGANISTVFLGSSNVTLRLKINGIERSSDTAVIIVKRPERIIDKIFTFSVIIFVSIMYINFGCAMDWGVCHRTLRKPIGPAIGIFCQFLFMPLISFAVGYLLFPNYPEMRMGIFFTGISPSGGASNIWTVLLEGNINLSITMTTVGTFVAFGMIPVWLYTLGKQIFNEAHLKIPYSRISFLAISLVVPLGIGYIIQVKFPKLSKFLVRIMKPFAIVLIIFIVIFAVITNMYLFKMFTWQIMVAGMGLPWLGFLFGLITAWILRQPGPDIRAIAIETGIQNTGIAIFLLQVAFKQPAADLTTVAPVSVAIMTPIPLSILYIILLLRRRKDGNKKKASAEKLNDIEQPITTITNSTYSSLNQNS